jgi:phosphoribosylformylglycinamidine synthase subunit PurQ / glutaminase
VPMVYTDNPNGSVGDTAAILDPSGRILGVMPHPERASDPDLGSADGLAIFTGARAWLDGKAPQHAKGASR